MNGTVFTFNHVPRKTTDTVQFKTTIWFDSTNNSTQRIHMSSHIAMLLIILTFDGHIDTTLSCANWLVTKTF
ncbi:Uncharacterised protein [Streptococcus pneumoniae]|nr:Uncharacterised protein [Streptococcus pneumoniae]